MTLPASVIQSVHNAYIRGELTSSRLIERCLAQIQARDLSGPGLNAVVAINESVQGQAQELDKVLARTRQLAGPLHGIPVLVKDNFHTADMPTRGGSITLSDQPTLTESEITRRLRGAGALMLAKTNMHELALSGTTVSSLAGQTLNPYDLRRTPGGSSGGTGAALAAAYGIIGLGTDTVNSIRSPASANCLVGLRPTRGLISRAGIMPVAETQDAAGPLTFTVSDAARVLDTIAGFDPADPVTARSTGRPAVSYLTSLTGSTLRGARIGVMRNLFGSDSVNRDVNAVMQAALALMRDAGAHLVDIHDDQIDSTRILEQLDVQKWEFREQFNAYLKQRHDPNIHTLSDLINDGRYHKPSLQMFLKSAQDVVNPFSDPDYLSRLRGMVALHDRLVYLLALHDVDAMVYPLQRCLVVPVDCPDQMQRNGIVASVSGLPAITVPAGFSDPSADAPVGVPVGMDMLGRPFSEARLLQLAYAFEQQASVYRTPSGFLDPLKQFGVETGHI